MESDPPEFIIGKGGSRIERVANIMIPFFDRSTDVIMDETERLEDPLLGERKDDLGRIKISGNGKSEDGLGGGIRPIREDFGRVVVFPQPVLKAEHLKIAEVFQILHSAAGVKGSTPSSERTAHFIESWVAGSGQITHSVEAKGIHENDTSGWQWRMAAQRAASR